MDKTKKLLKLADKIERITNSLKKIIKAMTPAERKRLADRVKEKL